MVTMFFFVYFQPPRNYVLNKYKDFRKCSPQSFSVRHELFKIRTLQQLKLFIISHSFSYLRKF